MTDLLVRLFVKNKDDTASQHGRQCYGQFAACVGMACNILLFAAKLFIGLISASVSVMADAFNNLSDVGSCLVTLFGFKLSSKPADREHPFGHGRIEYMSGFIVSVVIILVGAELLKTSVEKIINPTEIKVTAVSVVVLVLSILVKLWMGLFNRKIGRVINSTSMKAAAADSISDVISTGAVLLAMIISLISGFNLDGYIGVVVAVIIVFSGIGIARDTLNPLLGQPPEKEFIDEIVSRVMSYRLIVGVHDIVVHNYGPGRCYVSLHAEVPADANINVIHEIIDDCEHDISSEMNIEIVIHMDPVETDNEAVNIVKHQVRDILSSIDGRLTMHDFRMVVGESHTNLIFDVVESSDMKLTSQDLKNEISKRVSELNEKYICVINIDFDYTGK